MQRFGKFETVSIDVRRRLRRRRHVRFATNVLTALLVALVAATALAPDHLWPTSTVAVPIIFAVVLVLDLLLLFAPCPRCGNRLAEPSVLNLMVFPSPTAFSSACATCGVKLNEGSQ